MGALRVSLPPITIVMTTYFPPGEIGARRAEAASITARSWAEHLKYDGELFLHIADDGSDRDHWMTDLPLVRLNLLAGSRQERHGVGASLNAGFRAAFAASDDGLVLYAVDDWTLTADLDLTLWVELMQAWSISYLRLGPPHPDLTGKVTHWDAGGELIPGIWWLELDRHHFAFAHRPALYHRSLIEWYGWFAEDVNAYECERLYSVAINTGPAYAVLGLALHHPWKPIAEEPELELAGIDPRDG